MDGNTPSTVKGRNESGAARGALNTLPNHVKRNMSPSRIGPDRSRASLVRPCLNYGWPPRQVKRRESGEGLRRSSGSFGIRSESGGTKGGTRGVSVSKRGGFVDRRKRKSPSPIRARWIGLGEGNYQLRTKPSFSQRGRFLCTGFSRPKFALATSSDCT